MKKNKLHFISPYIFVMSTLLLILIIVGETIFFISAGGIENLSFKSVFDIIVFITIFFVLPLSLPIIFLVLMPYEVYGFWRADEEGIGFYTPLRLPFKMKYEDMRSIGIDFGVLNGTRQFWIYFSVQEIDMKYRHNIIRLPFRRGCMRIQYTRKKYDELLSIMPKEKAKQLNRAHSIITAYKEDDSVQGREQRSDPTTTRSNEARHSRNMKTPRKRFVFGVLLSVRDIVVGVYGLAVERQCEVQVISLADLAEGGIVHGALIFCEIVHRNMQFVCYNGPIDEKPPLFSLCETDFRFTVCYSRCRFCRMRLKINFIGGLCYVKKFNRAIYCRIKKSKRYDAAGCCRPFKCIQ